MTDMLILAPSLAVGAVLGTIFFGGLWWTVRKGLGSPQPALWFLGSMLLRTAIVLAGFYVIGGANWQRWLACLLGFVLGRLAVGWLTRGQAAGARHAP